MNPIGTTHVWHHRVHEWLGEKLFYYLASLENLDLPKLKDEISGFTSRHDYGSIRFYQLFGNYDLLIRVWLNPANELTFRENFSKEITGVNDMPWFTVQDIFLRWYSQDHPADSVDPRVIPDLVEVVRSVQDTTRCTEETIRLAEQRHLLIQTDKKAEYGPGFDALVAIRHSSDDYSFAETLASTIDLAFPKGGTSGLASLSIYSGFGFCRTLLRARVSSQPTLSGLISLILSSEKLKSDGPLKTETFIVCGSDPIAERWQIGNSTFAALSTINPLVNLILPEAYDGGVSEHQRKTIQSFIEDHTDQLSSRSDQHLVRDLFLAWLRSDSVEVAKIVLLFCIDLEAFLRRALRETKGSSADMDAANFEDLLLEASLRFGNASKGEPTAIDRIKALAELRNYVAHGEQLRIENMHMIASALLRSTPDLRALITNAQDETMISWTGRYILRGNPRSAQ